MVSNKVSITLILFFCINLISTNIYAANVGGWTLGGGVAQGASVVYEGTKKVIIDGKDYIKKGTSKITPPASGVAKVLARGAAGYALSVAVEQLLGAVDWVLDPVNSQIVYTVNCVATSSCPTSKYLYVNHYTNEKFSNSSSACTSIREYLTKTRTDIKINSFTLLALPQNPIGSKICLFNYDYQGKTYNDWKVGNVIANPDYDPKAEDQKKDITP